MIVTYLAVPERARTRGIIKKIHLKRDYTKCDICKDFLNNADLSRVAGRLSHMNVRNDSVCQVSSGLQLSGYLEHPTDVFTVMGSSQFRESDFFPFPTLVAC